NPCGEQWLGPYDACNLGSINLGLFVSDGKIDWEEMERVTRITTRFLDDVIDINPFPLKEVAEKVHANRRIGLGVMGWAEMLFELAFQHRVKQPDGSYRVLDFVNPFFQRALEASDIEDTAGVLTYAKEHGSLHGHPAERHPALQPYVTAHEIASDWHIRMQ